MPEATKKRGRPKTGNAKTAAQRQREYRIRKKAGLVRTNNVTRDDKSRIVELEARIAELEAEKRRLLGQLELESAEPVQQEPIQLWEQSGRQCQASTGTGQRCRSRNGLRIVESTLKNGRQVRLTVCPAHFRKYEARGGKLYPHSSCLA